jgi:ABC-2 type transport system ATP-binding protein
MVTQDVPAEIEVQVRSDNNKDQITKPEMQNEIILIDLVKKFADITAVNGLNLAVHKGEMFGFLGPNGAGKTTTISMLSGLLEPTSGTAEIGGFDIRKESSKTKGLIGVCPQEVAVRQPVRHG